MTTEPASRMLLQRLRNRIIDVLELAACAETQRDYQRSVPQVHVPDQVLNWWDDFVGDDWRQHYSSGAVFTPVEIDAIARFHAIHVEVSGQIQDLPLETLIPTAQWQRLLAAGSEALQVFLDRGRLPEDFEEHDLETS